MTNVQAPKCENVLLQHHNTKNGQQTCKRVKEKQKQNYGMQTS